MAGISEEEYKQMLARVNKGKKEEVYVQESLFSNREVISKKEWVQTSDKYRSVEFFIDGFEPLSKQSFRSVPARHRSTPNTLTTYTIKKGDRIIRGPQKGDVVIFINERTNKLDVVMNKYTDKNIVDATKRLRNLIKLQLPNDFEMFQKEIVITQLDFIFPPLKSFSKKKLKLLEDGIVIPKTTKPDGDNLEKFLWDAMQGVVLTNDSIIFYREKVIKRYGLVPGYIVKMKGI